MSTPESHRRNNKRWSQRNREKVREWARGYYQRNREAILAKHTARRRAAGVAEWDYRRRLYFKRKYGITPEQRDEMIAAQAGKCAICCSLFRPKKYNDTHLDHCHETGLVRGVLCAKCNRGMGMLGDNPTILQAAIDYLRRHHPGRIGG